MSKQIKNKINLKSYLKRSLVLLMSVAMCSSSLAMLAAEAAQAQTDVLTVSINWKSDVQMQGGVAKATTADRTVVVSATGKEGIVTEVVVRTFDISAKASEGEYPSITKTYTMKAGDVKEFTITSATGGHKVHGTNGNTNDKATEVGGNVYTKQFGVKIDSVGDNTVIGNNFLRAYVLARDGSFSTTKNSNISWYNNNNVNGSVPIGCIKTGYTYVGAYEVKSQYASPQSYSVKEEQSAYYTFVPSNMVSNATSSLLKYFDTSRVAYTGTVKIDDYKPVIHTGGFVMYFREYGASEDISSNSEGTQRFRNAHSGSVNWNNDVLYILDDSSIYNEGVTKDSSYWNSTVGRGNPIGMTHTYMNYITATEGLSTKLRMRNYATYYDKKFNDLQISVILLDDTAPKIVSYSVDSSSPYGFSSDGNYDKIYLSVKFSKPVQVEELGLADVDFGLTASVMNNGVQTTTLHFDYIDGSYTDTLIFEAELDPSDTLSGKSIYGDQIKIISFDKNDVRIGDMLMNTSNRNNGFDFSNIGTEEQRTLDCKIDTREPKLTATDYTSGVKKAHTVTVNIANMTTEGTVEYQWSTSGDPSQLVNDWSVLENYVVGDNAISAGGFNGERYLHVRAMSISGMKGTLVVGPLRFDNNVPIISSPENDYSRYKKEHELRINVTDTYSAISKIYLYVKDNSGNLVIDHRQVFGEGAVSPAFTQNGTLFTGTLSHTDVGLAENSYGAYSVGFAAEDSLGNRSSIVYSVQDVMLDNRDTFGVNIKNSAGTEELLPDESIVGTKVFYNDIDFMLVSTTQSGVSDVYSIYTVKLEGQVIYSNGSLVSGSWADYGFKSAPNIANSGGYMNASIGLSASANGLYEFVFQQNTKQSEVISIYATQRDATPVNYSAIYSEERLLVNRVWQFKTTRYYSFDGTAVHSTPYDKTTGGAASKPIFSTPEKAYEYALYMEYQDITLLYLGEDSESMSYIEALKSGSSSDYIKAPGQEDITPAANQTWICYKAKTWNVGSGYSSSRSSWVYYYYDSGERVDSISLERIKQKPLIYDAITDNAANIAGVTLDASRAVVADESEYIMLTALSSSGSYVDSYGQPYYSKNAIFYDAESAGTDKTVFAETDRIEYTGDKQIYSSFINYNTGTQNLTVPLIANYTFSVANKYNMVYVRAYGSSDGWTAISDKQTLKQISAIEQSGLYEFAEIGGGYRKYVAYVDFDAPLVSSRITRGGDSYDFTFTADLSGSSISAAQITLYDILDSAHKQAGRPEEHDEYAYIYLTTNGTVESFYKMLRLSDINEGDFSYTFPNKGTYTMYIYDRLGNRTDISIRVNNTPLIKDEPTEIINTSISFYVNRTVDELRNFAIYRTGESTPVDTIDTYQPTKTYYKSGEYSMVVEDIYGNSVTKAITFRRDPPQLTFYYKNNAGTYTQITPITEGSAQTTAATLERIDDNTYYISTSSDIRIGYTGSNYKYEMDPPTVTVSDVITASNNFYAIAQTDVKWTMRIYYENDPNVGVTVTCVKDTEPPNVSAKVSVPIYEFYDEYYHPNVLFGPKYDDSGNRVFKEENANSGTSLSGDSVTFSWSDTSQISSVSYTLNGGAPNSIAGVAGTKSGSFTATEEGQYVVTVRDILGNVNTFSFTLSDVIDFDVLLGGNELEYKLDPLSYIRNPSGSPSGAPIDPEKAIFTHTEYSSEDIALVLRENAMVAFAWTNGTDTAVYTLNYSDGQVIVGLYDAQAGVDENNQGLISYTVALVEGAINESLIANGDITVSYSYDDGVLTLKMPKTSLEYEQWQIRVTNTANTNPFIIQIERSGVAPKLDVVTKDDGAALVLPENGFAGINKEITLSGTFDKINSILAYFSAEYTMDFSDISVSNTYDLFVGGAVGSISEEGYYNIVVTDKYGNKQIIFVRISYGLNVDVIVDYAEIDDRTYTLANGGEYEYFTNNSIRLNIWDVDADISLTKDGSTASLISSNENGYIEVIIRNAGNYVLKITDECNNVYEMSITIAEPVTVVYDEYLTGFNQNAVLKNDNYTNDALSLNLEKLEVNGIVYVAYRASGGRNWISVYDMLLEGAEQNASSYVKCIGTEDGTYEVIFTDKYGNKCLITVYISSAEQLSIYKTTQAATKATPLTMTSVLSDGAWSNAKISIKNTAKDYRLSVNGEEVSFDENGEYVFALMSGIGEGSADYTVEYVDEYGNSYAFEVHLFRKVPLITTNAVGELIQHGGQPYVKGDISYTWEDSSLIASYTRNGGESIAYSKEQVLTEDGVYLLTFTDRAGNVANMTITRDTTVSYQLSYDNQAVESGITLSGSISIRTLGERLTALEILKDGESIKSDTLSFSEHGSYVVTLSDPIGNFETIYFDIFNHAVQSFVYTARSGYAISQLWYSVDGQRLSFVGGVALDADGNQTYGFELDGEYEVELLHLATEKLYTFKLKVDNLSPGALLVGAVDGGITRQSVKLDGLEKDDTVEIWKNGELVGVYTISSTLTSPEINEAGAYKIIIRDLAGNETVYTFEREFTTNTASNVMICLALVGISLGGIVLIRGRGRIRTK